MKLPSAEVELESTGAFHDPQQLRRALATIGDADATDVLVMVHGWNSDMSAARRLFERLGDGIADLQPRTAAARDRRIVVVGVLWPSVRWADDDELAGGGAGLGDDEARLRSTISDAIEDPDTADRLVALIPDLEESASARAEFLDLLRDQLPESITDDDDPPPSMLVEGDPADVFAHAAEPDSDLDGAARGGGALSFGPNEPGPNEPDERGGAAGFGILDRMTKGARTLLNLTTYYRMKRRSGDVGANGLATMLAAIRDQAPTARIHVVGHSFGARAAVAAVARQPVHSVALLQGAFSHHGLADNYDRVGHDGFFRAVLAPVPHLNGPMIVTHTANDKCVGVAYAVASRLARQRASGLGGPGDIYGGIGRNGALMTPEVDPATTTLLDADQPYDLTPGRVHNLVADRHISGHGAVTGPPVAHAILAAMTTPPEG